jgi:Transposase DDE domain group 1
VEEIARIVARLRASWPNVRILLRADSGFAREALMAWCEANRVDYLFGLARNARLAAMIESELAAAKSAAGAIWRSNSSHGTALTPSAILAWRGDRPADSAA